jgi:hypothetical protein
MADFFAVWQDYILITGAVMALCGWYIPKLFWFQNVILMGRIVFSLTLSFFVFSLIGAIFAILVGATTIGTEKILANFSMNSVYFFVEIGWERLIFALPTGLVRIIILSFRDFKRRKITTKSTATRMLDGNGFKIYVYFAFILVAFKYGLSIDWNIAAVLAVGATLIIQWLQNRSVRNYINNTIDDNYTIAKEYGYKTEHIVTDKSTGIKNIHLEKRIEITNEDAQKETVTINLYISSGRVRFTFYPLEANILTDEMVSISGFDGANLNGSALEAIEKNALGLSSYIPELT